MAEVKARLQRRLSARPTVHARLRSYQRVHAPLAGFKMQPRTSQSVKLRTMAPAASMALRRSLLVQPLAFLVPAELPLPWRVLWAVDPRHPSSALPEALSRLTSTRMLHSSQRSPGLARFRSHRASRWRRPRERALQLQNSRWSCHARMEGRRRTDLDSSPKAFCG